jgi:hypothetical protein
MRHAIGRLEAVGRELDQQTERVAEINRIHEAAVLYAAVSDAPCVEPLDRLQEGGAGNRKGDVVDAALIARGRRRVRAPRLVGENRDEAPITGIEVEVIFTRRVEVRLLEDEGHAEHALPEADRGFAVGADERDVVHALGLNLLHEKRP